MFRRAILCALMLTTGAMAGAQTDGLDAKAILQKTLDTYAHAKTYQGTWTYQQDRGTMTQKRIMQIKSKGRTRLLCQVAAPNAGRSTPQRSSGSGKSDVSSQPEQDINAIPEMLVVMDDKSAWFQNTSENTYFMITLPKNAQRSPLVFIPQLPAASALRRGPDLQSEGKTYYVLQTQTADEGTSRIEIDAATYLIHRIIEENTLATIKIVSTVTVDKETLDADLPDSIFIYKAPKGATEVTAPPGTAAMFGPG